MQLRLVVQLVAALVAGCIIVLLRILQVIRNTHARRCDAYGSTRPGQVRSSRLLVFLGSGGHTGEMLRMLHGLDFVRYSHRSYLVSAGDSLSLSKIAELERVRASDHTARNPACKTGPSIVFDGAVHNPAKLLDVILLNGPGSCVPIAVAAFLPRLFNMHSPRVVYVESMARVKRLSLSGKILRLFVDRFFVQWPAMAEAHNVRSRGWLAKVECRGLLV